MLEPSLALLVTELLNRELGHVPKPLPGSLGRRIRSLARAAGLPPEEWLARVVARRDAGAIEALVAAATVPHTAFFRHHEQLEHLKVVLPRVAARRGVVRMWSAGCATGEEPYSIAIVARQIGVPVRILATDISEESLAVARRGQYDARAARGLAGADPVSGWSASDEVRRMISFERSSLATRDPARGQGPFDIIFCRNVLIYFEPERALAIVEKLLRMLHPGGSLVVAPTETVLRAPWRRPEDEAPLGWFERFEDRAARPKSFGKLAVETATTRTAAHATGETARAAGTTTPTVETAGEIVDYDSERAARALASGDPDAAETALRVHLNAKPGDAEAWFLLGEALAARNERGQARAAFLKASRAASEQARGAEGTVEAETLEAAARRRAAALE